MKILTSLVFATFLSVHIYGATLGVWSDTVSGFEMFPEDKQTAANVSFTNTSLSVSATGSDFLVMSSFITSNAGTDKNRQGRWQIAEDYTGGPYTYSDAGSGGTVSGSAIYERWINGHEINGQNEYGAVNMNGIYHFGTSGTHTFNLFHRTNGGAEINTGNGAMTVIALNVGGTTLRHGSSMQNTTINPGGPAPFFSETTGSSWSAVEKSAGVDLASTVDISEFGGKIFLATSWNCNKSGAGTDPVTGEWQLVVYNNQGQVVERLDTTIKRDVIDENKDHGAAMLYATTSDLPKGEYTIKLEQRVSNGSTNKVETYNASINAVALTLQDGAEAGQYFESFSVSDNNTLTNTTATFQQAVAEEGLSLSSDQGLILAANFTTSGSGAQTARLELNVLEEGTTTSVFQSEEVLRTVGTSAGNGAAGVVGYSSLSAGDYDISLNFSHSTGDTNDLYITGAKMVGITTESIPEPVVTSIIGFFGLLIIVSKRIFFV